MAHPALLEAFNLHRQELFGFLARRLQCRFTAADLLQDIYLRLAQMSGADDAVQNSRAYLFRMAANLATDHLRVESRRRELLDEAGRGQEEASVPGPEQSLLASEQLQRLEQVLAALPPLSREIFFANRFGGLTQREIASEHGVSTTTVENHIRRVFDALRTARDAEQD